MESTERSKPVAKRCPNCGLPSPVAAPRCRCGHEYFGNTLPTPWVVAPVVSPAALPPAPARDWKSLFTRKGAPGGIIGGLSGLGGGLIGIYSGLNLLIPLGGAAAAIAIGSRVITGPSKHFVHAVGVQAGHILWFMAGLIVVGTAGLSQVAFDSIFMIAGMGWLLARPGPAPVFAMLIWQGARGRGEPDAAVRRAAGIG